MYKIDRCLKHYITVSVILVTKLEKLLTRKVEEMLSGFQTVFCDSCFLNLFFV